MYVSQDKPCYLNQLIQRTINLPKSITYPIPTSLPLKLTLILEPISPLRFSSKSSFSDDKNYCDGQISFLSNKNYGPCHHNKQKFRSVPPQQTTLKLANRAFPRTNICWIQRCWYKTPNFYNKLFLYCLYPILGSNFPFFTPLSNPPQCSLRIRPTKNLF